MKIKSACPSILIAALLTAMVACSDSSGPPQPDKDAVVKSMQFKHSNGLVLTLPDGDFQVLESETGFRLSPPNAESMRNPFEIEVFLHPGEPSPDGEWPNTRNVGTVDARYRIEVAAGGSGGDEHTLTAWIPCQSGHIVLRQAQQSEPPQKPDFNPAWVVLAAARCEDVASRD
jgi:hypothetical protein